MDWSSSMVRPTGDGAVELLLGASPLAAGRPVLGGEIQSQAVATTGTWSWTAQAPQMTPGAVFGMFTYKADWAHDPWLEFDFEFVGANTSRVQLTVHMEDASGAHVTNTEPTFIDLGFDAAEGVHTYDMTLTGEGAIFRVDGAVVAYFSGADMPGGVWNTGELKSFVDLWAADSQHKRWAGTWSAPDDPLVARLEGATVRPGDLGGAMPILGGAGEDLLRGTIGRDVIDGGAGNDTLRGGAGNDRLMGGYGDDALRLDGGDDWINGGDGEDWLLVPGGLPATIDLGGAKGSQDTGHGRDALRNIEHVQGGKGGDRILGSSAANTLRGGDGGDALDGRAGADTLVGGLGRDTLAGGWNDKARDLFVFTAVDESARGASTRDVIQGFERGIDDVDLSGIDANATLAGDQAFRWGGTTAGAFSTWTLTSRGTTYLRADTTGDGKADLEVQLNGVAKLLSGDVLL